MINRILIVAVPLALLVAVSCGKSNKVFQGMPDLVLTQAQFHKEIDENGDTNSVPGAARMVMIYRQGNDWDSEVVEDSQSNVFHKVTPFTSSTGEEGLLTIGANAAILKFWSKQPDGHWTAKSLYQGEYGGQQNRLRDFEYGDVTGDGKKELVIATHDQGVILVLKENNGQWEATEIDHKPDTFVHEIELGDVDGDGIDEIFATPSEPNRLDGTVQPGAIAEYNYDGTEFVRSVVERFPTRHVKEILCADLDQDGQPELYCAVEADMAEVMKGGGGVDIKQYQFGKNGITSKVIATLPDMLCRFLCAGDVYNDGRREIVASPLKSGVYVISNKNGQWIRSNIDNNSGGFEHATVITDLDGDGQNEIYVAADDQRSLDRLTWNGSTFDKVSLRPVAEDIFTFCVMPGKQAAYDHTENMRIGGFH